MKDSTLMAMELFGDDIKKSYILHIPHSKTYIPNLTGFDISKIDSEIQKLTDHSTDSIFQVDDITKIIFPYSRIYCDVERLEDDNEPMFKYGRGFFYTHTDDGDFLRSEEHKDYVYGIYKDYHKSFENVVDEKLESLGYATIIDCHSFSNIPFTSDMDKNFDRPDICIGIDSFHTPYNLLELFRVGFEKQGLSVKINSPYSGTIIPLKHYQKNKNVHSIMIEINRDLYMKNGNVDLLEVGVLNKIFKNILLVE